MTLIWFCLLVAFSLNSAAKCDDYVVGTVWEHKGGAADESVSFQGCKKGCFWNKTYTEMGVRKCEKCEDITEETTCTNNDATCRWKKGKCKPQSCPEIANTRNTGAFVFDNSEAAVSKGRARLLKECVEGSELEKKFNNQYWEDYKEKVNWQYFEDGCPSDRRVDTCSNPCSPPGPVSKSRCIDGFFGNCVWSEDEANPGMGTCRRPTSCGDAGNEADCRRLSFAGCAWNNQVGDGTCSGSGSFTYAIPCPDFVPGKHGRVHCERLGCTYTGRGSQSVNFEDTCTTTNPHPCFPFTPGKGVSTEAAQTSCQNLGCTYTAVNYPIGADTLSVGCDFKTECPSTNPAPPSHECAVNASFALDGSNTGLQPVCFDRTYPFDENAAPSVQTDGKCRLLFDIQRQQCEFNVASLLSTRVFINGVDASDGYRRGTLYDRCLQTQKNLLDPYAIVKDSDGRTEPEKMTEENREKLYGYSSPEDYCKAEREREIAKCQKTYEIQVNSCYSDDDENNNTLQPESLFRDHVHTKAARAACSEIYGCMYDEKNERCSAWAVWALVLTIVLVVVVVLAALAVVGVFILLKVVKSKA